MLCGDTAGTGSDTDVTDRTVTDTIDGIDVIRIMEPYSNSMGFIERVKSFLRFSYHASLIAMKEKPDLIYATSTPLTVGIPAIACQIKTGAPFIFEVRDLWPTLPVAMGAIKNPALIWLLRMLERTIYRRSDAIITLAPGMKGEIESVNGAPQTIEFVPNGCDIDLFHPDAEPTLLPEINYNNFNLVYCGHHGVANGLDALIEAAEVLKSRDINHVRFIMIGKGSEKSRLVDDARKRKVEHYFQWLDPVPKIQLARLLPAMDAGLMPLMNVTAFHNGTSPNKFFDYIAAGLPVVTNYPGWIATKIRECSCGYYVKPDNPEKLADTILELSQLSDSRISEMRHNSRELAVDSFSRQKLGETFVSTIETIANERIAAASQQVS
jgi:glycosyltransferase involved in cell wall biosynthesis